MRIAALAIVSTLASPAVVQAQTVDETVQRQPGEDAPPATPAPAEATSATLPEPAAETVGTRPATGSVVPTTVWITLGVGAAGLVVGGITGALAKSKHDELAPRCPNSLCESEDRDGVRSLHTLRDVSTTACVLGGASLATAVVLWLIEPAKPAQAYVRPMLGFGTLGAQGAF